MNKITYTAKIYKDEEGNYLVEFPELEGCLTFGVSLKEAKEMASEALSLYLDSIVIDENKPLPKQGDYSGKNYYQITATLGESTSYSEYHKKSYNKNKEKILSKKKDKEKELKELGYKNFREFLHKDTIKKLDKVVKSKNTNRREFITNIIEKEFKKLTV